MAEERGALIGAMARGIADGIGDDFDHAHRSKPHWIETRGESGGRYRDINEPRQSDYLDAAQSALTAISNAGYAVVPNDPPMSMIEAGVDAFWPGPEIVYPDEHSGPEHAIQAAYRAMISGSPITTKGTNE